MAAEIHNHVRRRKVDGQLLLTTRDGKISSGDSRAAAAAPKRNEKLVPLGWKKPDLTAFYEAEIVKVTYHQSKTGWRKAPRMKIKAPGVSQSLHPRQSVLAGVDHTQGRWGCEFPRDAVLNLADIHKVFGGGANRVIDALSLVSIDYRREGALWTEMVETVTLVGDSQRKNTVLLEDFIASLKKPYQVGCVLDDMPGQPPYA